MKKVMMIAAAMLIAGAAQAYTINWGADFVSSSNNTAGADPVYHGYAHAGTVFKLVLGEFTAATGKAVADFTAADFAALDAVDTFTMSASDAWTTFGNGGAYTFTIDDDHYGANQVFTCIASDPLAIGADANGYFGYGSFTGPAAYLPTDPAYHGILNETMDVSLYAFAAPVPEPTTAALLALGIAALGLRRKMR